MYNTLITVSRFTSKAGTV